LSGVSLFIIGSAAKYNSDSGSGSGDGLGLTNAWFGGGRPGTVSTVERIIFASDTATAVVKGPLSVGRYVLAAHGNTTDAWYMGGSFINPGPGPSISCRVDRIIFSSDTATAVAKGPLNKAREYVSNAALGNTTDAWVACGQIDSAPHPNSQTERIIFASDTAAAVVKGRLTASKWGIAAHGSTTDGWFGGGYNPDFSSHPATGNLSRVDRTIFSSDTATAVAKGPLTVKRYLLAAHGSTTDGWFGGGYTIYGGYRSTIDRIIFASDTATAVAKGPLTIARYELSASGSTTDSWFGGGVGDAGITSRVDRVIFSSDTSTAVAKGPLSQTRYGLAGN